MHAVLFNLLGHNQWATKILIEECTQLPPESWEAEFEIGLGSLRKTHTHIVGAMLRWSDRISERTVASSIESQVLSPYTLLELLDRASLDLSAIAEDLENRDAHSQQFRFEMPEGTAYRFSKGAALTHVLTHGMHHRAQALNIRRRLGLPPMRLDLDVVEWEAIRTGQIDPSG